MIKRTPTKWFASDGPWSYGLTWKRLHQHFMEGTYRPDRKPVAWQGELVRMMADKPSSFTFLGAKAKDTHVRKVLPIAAYVQWLAFLKSDSWEKFCNNEHPDLHASEYHSIELPTTFRLRQRLEAIQQKRATASQWMATIEGMSGVQAWEKVWSGLWDWLADQKDNVVITRQQIVDAAHFRCVKPKILVNWTTKGITELRFDQSDSVPTLKQQMQLKQDGRWSQIVLANRAIGYKISETRRPDLFEEVINYWRVFDRYSRLMPRGKARRFDSAKDAIKFCWQDASSRHSLRGASQASKQWAQYAIANNGYQETLLTLPNFPADMEDGHYECRNVLFFVRTSIAYTSSGRRTLLIEELQSDWLQDPDLRKVGWAERGTPGSVPVPLHKRWGTLACELAMYLAVQKRCEFVAISDWKILANRYGRHAKREALRRFYDETIPKTLNGLIELYGQSLKTRRVFVEGTKHMSVKTDHGWKLVDENGVMVLGDRESRDVLIKDAIEKKLMEPYLLPAIFLCSQHRRAIKVAGLAL